MIGNMISKVPPYERKATMDLINSRSDEVIFRNTVADMYRTMEDLHHAIDDLKVTESTTEEKLLETTAQEKNLEYTAEDKHGLLIKRNDADAWVNKDYGKRLASDRFDRVVRFKELKLEELKKALHDMKQIGSVGFGNVYKSTLDGKDVAIKLLN